MVRTVRGSQTILATLAVFLGLATSSQADLTHGNGDFEAGGTGWATEGIANFVTSDGNGIAVLNENDSYTRSDDKGLFNFSSITQDFTRPAAATQLDFDFKMYAIPGETDYFQILLNGTVVEIASTDNLGLDDEWHHVSHDISFLPADPVQNTLVFRLKGYNDDVVTTVELDNVRIVPVPVPAAAWLASLGLACAARRLRRS